MKQTYFNNKPDSIFQAAYNVLTEQVSETSLNENMVLDAEGEKVENLGGSRNSVAGKAVNAIAANGLYGKFLTIRKKGYEGGDHVVPRDEELIIGYCFGVSYEGGANLKLKLQKWDIEKNKQTTERVEISVNTGSSYYEITYFDPKFEPVDGAY